LAYALLPYTDQRGGDVVRMRRQDIRAGAIKVTQEKTGRELVIPIHPPLARAMKAGPNKSIYLIGDEHGRPIQRQTLTRLVKAAAKAAGLPPRCLPHGLRKALQRRLAERGASTKELQAVAGHASLKETERYTRAADQEHLARAAFARLPDEDGV
jgi:integrase